MNILTDVHLPSTVSSCQCKQYYIQNTVQIHATIFTWLSKYSKMKGIQKKVIDLYRIYLHVHHEIHGRPLISI